jgi:hypothetical protein
MDTTLVLVIIGFLPLTAPSHNIFTNDFGALNKNPSSYNMLYVSVSLSNHDFDGILPFSSEKLS